MKGLTNPRTIPVIENLSQFLREFNTGGLPLVHQLAMEHELFMTSMQRKSAGNALYCGNSICIYTVFRVLSNVIFNLTRNF